MTQDKEPVDVYVMSDENISQRLSTIDTKLRQLENRLEIVHRMINAHDKHLWKLQQGNTVLGVMLITILVLNVLLLIITFQLLGVIQ